MEERQEEPAPAAGKAAGPDDLLTVREAADLAGVRYHTVYTSARMGIIPYVRRADQARRAHGGGEILLFRRADVEAYMARRDARKGRPALTNAERQRRKYAKKKGQRAPEGAT